MHRDTDNSEIYRGTEPVEDLISPGDHEIGHILRECLNYGDACIL
jgi:hypothetical protein